ncbi:MAG: MBL fold metallo-hydrolase [Deltaproteobacteria bacterium]|nr:MBL fold metallo-hydrolase [Deltaproteobacteria bacterium]
MELRRIVTPGIGHFAYLIADGGEAAVVDPRRDVDEYLAMARRLGVRVSHVVETHRQEDFVMGSAHLAERTGARIVNGQHELFGHGDLRLSDGDSFRVGGLRIEALHTPGHTPESMCYAVYDEASSGAWGVFTGDALFFGDTGRTDLTDADRTAENAGLLHDAVHEKLAPLGDGARVLPAHGPGSVCGSGMAERPSSTIGAERQYNKVFTLSREAFMRAKEGERIPRPPYFRHMEEINLEGGRPPVRDPDDVALVGVDELAQALEDAMCVDTREPEGFAGGHIRDAFSIWLGGLPVFGGWLAQPDTPIYLVGDRDDDVATAFTHLSRIGIDGVRGALAGGLGAWRASGRPMARSGVIFPRELAERREEMQILDVREADEFASGHIPGARHVYVGHLQERLGGLDLDPQETVAVTCGVGHRAGVAVSILLRAGYSDVRNLLGGMSAWQACELPTEARR